MTQADLLLIEDIAAGVRQFTFNRQEKLNALSEPLIQRLGDALDAAATDDSVRVLILTGAGRKAFIAGADIAEYRDGRSEAFAAYQYASRVVFDRLETLPKPTIALINGYALGGGLELALCCDLIICASAAKLGLPEGKLGLVPGGGGMQRLVRLIGRQATAHMLLTGWSISGQRAYELGLASACVPDDAAMAAALDMATQMTKLAPLSQAEAKRRLREGSGTPLHEAIDGDIEALIALFDTADGREGIEAFLEKRAPSFTGR